MIVLPAPIIGEQIPKRALLKELLVHRFDLVRVRLDSRRVDSSKRIREMSVLEPTRFQMPAEIGRHLHRTTNDAESQHRNQRCRRR